MRVKYSVVIPARNEEERLPKTLDSVFSQTLGPKKVIVVNDGSTDGTERIALEYGCEVVTLPYHKESWSGTPNLSRVFNAGVEMVGGVDFFAILGADTVVEKEYFEKVVNGMLDNKYVIASGVVEGEYSHQPRGTGRVFLKRFWDKYVGRFPYCYSWEPYPLYKALSLGLKIGVIREARMLVTRKTFYYKESYGYAMREFGYFPPYAVMRCLRAFVSDQKTGVNMLRTYLSKRTRVVDPGIQGFLLRKQAKILLNPFRYVREVRW